MLIKTVILLHDNPKTIAKELKVHGIMYYNYLTLVNSVYAWILTHVLMGFVCSFMKHINWNLWIPVLLCTKFWFSLCHACSVQVGYYIEVSQKQQHWDGVYTSVLTSWMFYCIIWYFLCVPVQPTSFLYWTIFGTLQEKY